MWSECEHGFTVMIAMAGMFLSGSKFFMSFAIGTMMVVFVAMIGSLTVLPAILSVLGDRVEKGRIPFLGRRRRESAEGSRMWGAILRPVLRHPLIAALTSAAVLVVIALPALQLHTADAGLDGFPKSLPELQSLRAVEDAFPGGARAATVAIRSDDPAQVESAIADLRTMALASGEMRNPIEVERSPDGSTYRVDIPLAGAGTDEASDHALATLRDEVLPATLATVPGVEYAVTGFTAESRDFTDAMKSSAPLIFGFVLLLAFLLLLAAFRSIVVALKAIVLNLLSVAAAYGVLVAVFQWGWGENLLDFNSTGGIAPWLPMFLFVILFGLSMDYHVFILSRVREAYDRGMFNEGRRRARHPLHRRRRHQRFGRDGGRVQRLRAPSPHRRQGDGHRPLGRHPDRRHHRPGGAAAGDDDPAGRRQLVPAPLARVAAASSTSARTPARFPRPHSSR